MADYTKNSKGIFEKLTSFGYLNRNAVELPKVSLATQDTGKEILIEKNQTLVKSKHDMKSTPNRKGINKALKIIDRSTNANKMSLKVNLTPQKKGKIDEESCNLNGTNKDHDNFADERLLDHQQNSLRKANKNDFKKNETSIAFNLNFALNVDPTKEKKDSFLSTEKQHQVDMNTPSSIKVAVRMRPLTDNEKASQGDEIKDILLKDNLIIIPHKKESFEFDYCFNSSNTELFNYASQECVYRKMGEPLLNYAYQGYNVCLFAYGQSGSGKTYTMMGTEDVPGVVPRFLHDLFRKINLSPNIEFVVNISFLEIYNEKIHDLLSDEFNQINKNLRVRENPQTGTYVEDLTFYTVETYEHAMDLLRSGNSRRATATTNSNEQSSRSHSIFNIILMQNKKIESLDTENTEQTSCVSKINLVDLAGSERANQSNHDRFREGTMINKSLLTLGKVITQLAECNNQLKSAHIPYRDSILTYLLKDSLGGNSRTSMIATISPAKVHLDETLSTLRYASTAQKIVNIVYKNEDPKVQIINSLLKQISSLKKEVERKEESSKNVLKLVNESQESEEKQSEICYKDLRKMMNTLNVKFEELAKQKNKVLDLVSEVKFSTKTKEPEVFTYRSDLVNKMKEILKTVKEKNPIKDMNDFESIADKIIEKNRQDVVKEKGESGKTTATTTATSTSSQQECNQKESKAKNKKDDVSSTINEIVVDEIEDDSFKVVKNKKNKGQKIDLLSTSIDVETKIDEDETPKDNIDLIEDKKDQTKQQVEKNENEIVKKNDTVDDYEDAKEVLSDEEKENNNNNNDDDNDDDDDDDDDEGSGSKSKRGGKNKQNANNKNKNAKASKKKGKNKRKK